MMVYEARPSTLYRACRASSSRSHIRLPCAPTPRPITASPCEMGYVWKGSGETRNMHDETVMLDVYLLPSTGHYLYLINVKKPVRPGSTRR